MNGLDINKENFEKMKIKDKLDIIYLNVAEIRKRQTGDKFHRKILYTWCGVLTTGLATLLGLNKWFPS